MRKKYTKAGKNHIVVVILPLPCLGPYPDDVGKKHLSVFLNTPLTTFLLSIQIFFERQCGPPKSTHYIFGQFYDAMDVDIGENHLAVYLLEDIKVRYTFVM